MTGAVDPLPPAACHDLTLLPDWFDEVDRGTRTFIAIYRKGRQFRPGDLLHIQEVDLTRPISREAMARGGLLDTELYTGRSTVHRAGTVDTDILGVDLGDRAVISLLPIEHGDMARLKNDQQ